ncbi:MAG: hypothetical protein IIT36_05360 [Aeriscardovia sp.]|nr:hypothetical protein [Aeriscardovia sp.]
MNATLFTNNDDDATIHTKQCWDEINTDDEVDEMEEPTKEVVTHNPLIPDVVCELDDGSVASLDAKYYVPRFAKDSNGLPRIMAHPGQHDLVKEYFYQLLTETRYKQSGTTVSANGFLLPARRRADVDHTGPQATVWGDIRFNFLDALELSHTGHDDRHPFHSVLYCELDPWAAFAKYTDPNVEPSVFDRRQVLRILTENPVFSAS